MLYGEEDIKDQVTRYRLALENRDSTNAILLHPLERNIVVERILNDFSGLNTAPNEILKTSDYNHFLKNIKTFLYGYFRFCSQYQRVVDLEMRENSNVIKLIESLYNKNLCNFESIKKKLNSGGSDFIVRKFFEQRNLNETYDLIDRKEGNFFQKHELANVKNNCINSGIKNESLITPKRVSVFGRSKHSEKIEKSADTSKLWREGERFKYIVFKEEREEISSAGMNKAELNIEFNFGFIQNVNRVDVDFGSYLPCILNIDKFKYYNEETKSWNKIDIETSIRNIKKTTFYFEKVQTRKIRICFDQYKNLNSVAENFLTIDEKFNLEILNPSNQQESLQKMYEVYDLSIDHIEFNYEKYFNKSIYRENNYIEFDKLKYLNLTLESKLGDKCFIESEIEVQYYETGKENWGWEVMPVPTSYKMKERIFYKKGELILTFPVKETGDFLLYDEDETLISTDNYSLELKNSEKDLHVYNTYVKFGLNYTVDSFYYAEYEINNVIRYENAVYENNLLKFKNNLENKRGAVRPRFILRSLNKAGASSFITKYSVEKNKKVDAVNISSKYKILKG